MILKKVVGRSVREALVLAQKEMGEGALIVETRITEKGAELVTARPERTILPAPATRTRTASRGRAGEFEEGFLALAERAFAVGLSEVVVRTLARALSGLEVRLDRPGDPALLNIASRVLAGLIPTIAPSDLQRVLALVGPTGVGKTTTAVKLAARAATEESKSAVLFTMDLHRVSAVDQIRALAELVGIPLEVIMTPVDLRRALARHETVERVIIDTAGRSPRDREALMRMAASFRELSMDRVLCVPAASRRVDVERLARAYESLAPRAVAMTKWDETECPGEVVSWAIEQGVPICLLTDGQEVPGHLRPVDAAALARELLGGQP